MKDFFQRAFVRAMSQPPPRFLQRLEQQDGDSEPVKSPTLALMLVLASAVMGLALIIMDMLQGF